MLTQRLFGLTPSARRVPRFSTSFVTLSFHAGLGVCATTLVERGTLKVGDVFTAGAAWGKCRALQDEFGNSLEEAGPSTPVRLVGWTTGADRAPRAGDALSVVPDEPTARKLADARNELANQARDAKLRAASSSGFDKLALCRNQISGASRQRRDIILVIASARWRRASTPSTRRRTRNCVCSMA